MQKFLTKSLAFSLLILAHAMPQVWAAEPDIDEEFERPTQPQIDREIETTPERMQGAGEQGQILGGILGSDDAVDNASVRQKTQQALAEAERLKLETLKDLAEDKLTAEQVLLQQMEMALAAKAGALQGMRNGPRNRGGGGQQSGSQSQNATAYEPQAQVQEQPGMPSFPSAQDSALPWARSGQSSQPGAPAAPLASGADSQIVILSQPINSAGTNTGGAPDGQTPGEPLGDRSISSLQLDESMPTQNPAQSPQDGVGPGNTFANQIDRLNQLGSLLDREMAAELAKKAAAKKAETDGADKNDKNPNVAQGGAGNNAGTEPSQLSPPSQGVSGPLGSSVATSESESASTSFFDGLRRWLTGPPAEKTARLDPEAQRKIDSLQGNVDKLQNEKNSLTLALVFGLSMLLVLIAAPLAAKWGRRRKLASSARRKTPHARKGDRKEGRHDKAS